MGFVSLSLPSFQGTRGEKLKKVSENSKNLGYQERKFKISLEGTRHLRLPWVFLELMPIFPGAEFKALIKLWDFYQSPEVRDPEKFAIGRAKLARLAGVGEARAYSCLKRLERLELILATPGKGGAKKATVYRWNWGKLKTELYQNDTSTVSKRDIELYQNDTRTVSKRYNLYITSLLIQFNPSYSALSGHAPTVENSDAPKARLLPDEKVAALHTAIETLWERTAPSGQRYTWPLTDIHDVLWSFHINLWKVENVTDYLRKVLMSGEALYKFRKQNPETHERTEDELLAQLETINQLSREGGACHA